MKKIITSIIFILVFLVSFTTLKAETVGDTLTGHYTYFDPEGDPEGASVYQWYRDNVAIPGATGITYLTTQADLNKTIVFEVTPVALTGIATPGIPIRSSGIIITAPVVVSSGGSSGGMLPGYSNQTVLNTPVVPASTDSTISNSTPSVSIASTKPFVISGSSIKYKSISSDVKLLQIYLNTHGYVVSKTGAGSVGKETNYYGPATKAAVKKFQQANNIIADGSIVGPQTLKAIRSK